MVTCVYTVQAHWTIQRNTEYLCVVVNLLFPARMLLLFELKQSFTVRAVMPIARVLIFQKPRVPWRRLVLNKDKKYAKSNRYYRIYLELSRKLDKSVHSDTGIT